MSFALLWSGLWPPPLFRASTCLTFTRSEGRLPALSSPSRALLPAASFSGHPYRSRARSDIGSVARPPLSEFGARPPAFPTHLTDHSLHISYPMTCVPHLSLSLNRFLPLRSPSCHSLSRQLQRVVWQMLRHGV